MMIPGAKNGDPAGVRQIQKTVCQIVKTCPLGEVILQERVF